MNVRYVLDFLAWMQISFCFGASLATLVIYSRLYQITRRPLYWHILTISASHVIFVFLLCSAIPFGIAASWPNWRGVLLVLGSLLTDVGIVQIFRIQVRRLKEVGEVVSKDDFEKLNDYAHHIKHDLAGNLQVLTSRLDRFDLQLRAILNALSEQSRRQNEEG